MGGALQRERKHKSVGEGYDWVIEKWGAALAGRWESGGWSEAEWGRMNSWMMKNSCQWRGNHREE
jgi:hypothetical protein